jgi:GDPmannose 4,6-dehydratase
LDIFEKINLIPADLIDTASIVEAIEISRPSELYHLAAQSFVGTSFEQPIGTGEITGMGVTRILEAIREIDRKIKFYQASTSELYGRGNYKYQHENTFFCPASPYAAAKLYGYWLTRLYREGYGLFACNGILFNHESPIRGLEFVTRKISNTVAKIALGLEKELRLGNLHAKRDWGYAPEYVESMWLMLQKEKADDYVIATAETHSVEEFLSEAFKIANLNWKKYVKVNKMLYRPLEVDMLKGDYSKAKEKLGWKPKTKFKDLVKIMVKEDLRRWESWLGGKKFPWDAINYPGENKILSRQYRLDR